MDPSASGRFRCVRVVRFLVGPDVPIGAPRVWCLSCRRPYPRAVLTLVLAGLAVAVALLRNGARYFDLATNRGNAILFADLCGIVAFVAGLLVLLAYTDPFAAVVGAWFASGFASLLWTGSRMWNFGGGPRSWVRVHKQQIRPLLVDSLLLDAGSIGSPLLLAPFLGATNFGIYRGISNVALPVRLILEPLRPSIGGQRPDSVFARRTLVFVLGLSSALAVACYLALELVVPLLKLQTSTLGVLADYALPSSLFVLANFVGHYYYIVCRARATQSQILAGRLAQTIGAISLPILGFIALDLIGAIWGFVAATSSRGACNPCLPGPRRPARYRAGIPLTVWCGSTLRTTHAAAPTTACCPTVRP
jgi:hypothetical protein